MKLPLSVEYAKKISNATDALSDKWRIRTFYWIENGEEIKNIPDKINRSRSTLQGYLDKLRGANLVQDTDQGYVLSPKGRLFHSLIEKSADELEKSQKRFLQDEQERMEELGNEDGFHVDSEYVYEDKSQSEPNEGYEFEEIFIESFSKLTTPERVQIYFLLELDSVKNAENIRAQVDINKSTLQNTLSGFKNANLVEYQNSEYVYSWQGEVFIKLLKGARRGLVEIDKNRIE